MMNEPHPGSLNSVATEIAHSEIGESELRAVFESTLDGLALLDKEHKIVRANRSFLELVGLDRNRVVGRNVSSVLSINDFQATPRTEKSFSGEIKRTSAQAQTHCLSYFVHIDVAPDRDLVVLRDTTQENELEQQVRQLQKMEAIGRVVGGVAHDFNNMLTVIRGYSELLLAEIEPESPLRKYADGIINVAERSANMTRQLLAFSRRQVLRLENINLNELVMRTSEFLQRLIGENIEVRTSLSDGLGLVTADSTQLDQVLLNLAINARDAMPVGGILVISTTNVEIDSAYCDVHVATDPGSYVLLSVADNGCGMEKETQSRIFEPFFTTKACGRGTGLGLSTVYGIVKQCGGHIWAYSEQGEGTTFKIYLPRVDHAGSVGSARKLSKFHNGHGETILVIDDDDDARAMICEILRQHGYAVLAADSGDTAMTSACHAKSLDLVLTDVVMHGTSGQDISGWLTAQHPHAKILYMSGFAKADLEARGIDIPAQTFLEKPFRVAELLQRVSTLLASNAPSRD